MLFHFRPLHLGLAAALLSVALVAVVELVHMGRNSSPASWARRFPPGDATTVYLDVAAIRAAGLMDVLQGVDVPEEGDYRSFVQATGFDYARDLDGVMASFRDTATYLLLQGHFDWGRLIDYVNQQDGNCYNGLCRMAGSTPERQISFMAITPRVMAMAVSADMTAVWALQSERDTDPAIPEAPVWLSLSGSRLERSSWLPAGTHSFVSAVSDSDRGTRSLAPSNAEFEARLDVSCESREKAQQLADRLKSVTELLASLIRRERQQPNPNDLSGVLTAGTFECDGARMRGRWPVRRAFLEGILLGGSP